jgi:hypothetical protein
VRHLHFLLSNEALLRVAAGGGDGRRLWGGFAFLAHRFGFPLPRRPSKGGGVAELAWTFTLKALVSIGKSLIRRENTHIERTNLQLEFRGITGGEAW